MGKACAAVGQPHESRPADHARKKLSGRSANSRRVYPVPSDFEARPQLTGDLSVAEIERRFQAHMAYLKRQPRRDDALVSATTASSLTTEHAIWRGIRLR